MVKRLIYICVLFVAPVAAGGATCDVGYYLNNGECIKCISGYYCPDENTKIPCPIDTDDWYAIYASMGYEVLGISPKAYYSWSPGGGGAYAITHCHIGQSVATSIGSFHTEPRFGGTAYNQNAALLWHGAATGYYLSPYSWSSSNNWYSGVKPCTNAPEHAHYTGPGTPDAPKSGGAKDANDCPWECDDGYGNHGGECAPLCDAGIQYIKTNSGLTINLYPVAYSSPALHIKYNGQTCYGTLAPGTTDGTINIQYDGKIYHTVD